MENSASSSAASNHSPSAAAPAAATIIRKSISKRPARTEPTASVTVNQPPKNTAARYRPNGTLAGTGANAPSDQPRATQTPARPAKMISVRSPKRPPCAWPPVPWLCPPCSPGPWSWPAWSSCATATTRSASLLDDRHAEPAERLAEARLGRRGAVELDAERAARVGRRLGDARQPGEARRDGPRPRLVAQPLDLPQDVPELTRDLRPGALGRPPQRRQRDGGGVVVEAELRWLAASRLDDVSARDARRRGEGIDEARGASVARVRYFGKQDRQIEAERGGHRVSGRVRRARRAAGRSAGRRRRPSQCGPRPLGPLCADSGPPVGPLGRRLEHTCAGGDGGARTPTSLASGRRADREDAGLTWAASLHGLLAGASRRVHAESWSERVELDLTRS